MTVVTFAFLAYPNKILFCPVQCCVSKPGLYMLPLYIYMRAESTASEWIMILYTRFYIKWTGAVIYIGKWVIKMGARVCASWYEIEIATIPLHYYYSIHQSHKLETPWNNCSDWLEQFTYPFNHQISDHSTSCDCEFCVWKDCSITCTFFT